MVAAAAAAPMVSSKYARLTYSYVGRKGARSLTNVSTRVHNFLATFETPRPVRFAASITSIALLRGTTSFSHVTLAQSVPHLRSHIRAADFPNNFIFNN